VDHPLQDFRLKLNRANGHLQTLQGEIDAWFESHPYGVTGKYDPGPPEKYILYLRFFDPPPREWGLLIGEFAHNARSALDYLAWQLVKANNKVPTRRTQFPIVFTPWDWQGRNGAGRLRGASERHIGMVEESQPYGRPDADGFYYVTHGLFEHPLALLSFLSNEDKHRVLIVGAAALSSIGWDIIGTRDVAPITDYGDPYLGPLEDGSPLIEIPIRATGPNPEVDVEFVERARIAVDHRIEVPPRGAIVSRVDLLDGLKEIASELRRIFQVFVREFV
jgi:hypothetical protein